MVCLFILYVMITNCNHFLCAFIMWMLLRSCCSCFCSLLLLLKSLLIDSANSICLESIWEYIWQEIRNWLLESKGKFTGPVGVKQNYWKVVYKYQWVILERYRSCQHHSWRWHQQARTQGEIWGSSHEPTFSVGTKTLCCSPYSRTEVEQKKIFAFTLVANEAECFTALRECTLLCMHAWSGHNLFQFCMFCKHSWTENLLLTVVPVVWLKCLKITKAQQSEGPYCQSSNGSMLWRYENYCWGESSDGIADFCTSQKIKNMKLLA